MKLKYFLETIWRCRIIAYYCLIYRYTGRIPSDDYFRTLSIRAVTVKWLSRNTATRIPRTSSIMRGPHTPHKFPVVQTANGARLSDIMGLTNYLLLFASALIVNQRKVFQGKLKDWKTGGQRKYLAVTFERLVRSSKTTLRNSIFPLQI